jgi:hypothetical protein
MLEIRTVASLRRNIEMARCRAIGGQNFPLARPTVSFIFGFDSDKWQVYDQVRIRNNLPKKQSAAEAGSPGARVQKREQYCCVVGLLGVFSLEFVDR